MRTVRVLLAFSLLMTMVAAGSGAASAAGERSSYIVVFEPGAVADVEAAASQLARAHGGQLGFVYQHALEGFSVTLSGQAAAALARNPVVAYVEADQIAQIAAQEVPTGVQRIFADENSNIDIDATDDYRVDVDVAIIDTGIDLDHPELNVAGSVDCTNESGGPPWARTVTCGSGGDDDNDHGTHVAGSVGALDNSIGVVGVAPGARLWAVKVLKANGSGSYSMVIAGVDWVTANAGTIEVANMSLGGGDSQALKDAIANSVDVGVAYAVAAGNSGVDAKDYSPANSPDVLTVSALADFDGEPGGLGSPTCRTDQDDTLADFSNWGSTIEIAAPGVCILSTVPGGYATYSGTSMASPHAAGALALLASSNNPGNATDVQNLYGHVINAGNFNWTDDSGDGIQEPLLDVSNTTLFNPVLVAGSDSGGSDPDTTPPAAPTGLSATAGDSQVTLNWDDNAESDLASYNVYRSESPSSYGSPLATGVTQSGYTDGTAANNTTYYYVVTAVDTSGNESGYSNEVSATPQAVTGFMHVGDLDGSKNIKGKSGKWEVFVTVTIHDGDHNPVSNATVDGTWSGDASGSASGVTDSTGKITFSSGNIDGGSSAIFTVDSVTHSSLPYASSANHDPDGDSDGTSITVSKT